MQSMDFGAYLASSSSEDEGEGPSGRGQDATTNEDDRIQKYIVADTMHGFVASVIDMFMI